LCQWQINGHYPDPWHYKLTKEVVSDLVIFRGYIDSVLRLYKPYNTNQNLYPRDGSPWHDPFTDLYYSLSISRHYYLGDARFYISVKNGWLFLDAKPKPYDNSYRLKRYCTDVDKRDRWKDYEVQFKFKQGIGDKLEVLYRMFDDEFRYKMDIKSNSQKIVRWKGLDEVVLSSNNVDIVMDNLNSWKITSKNEGSKVVSEVYLNDSKVLDFEDPDPGWMVTGGVGLSVPANTSGYFKDLYVKKI